MEEATNDTITIKKESLWKYSTVILFVILVIGAFLYIQKGNTTVNGNAVAVNDNSENAAATGNAINNANTAQPTAQADIAQFGKDPTLYPSIGPQDSKVTVIEFSDFQCPFCAIAAGLADFAKQYNSGQYADLFGSAGKVQQLAVAGKIKFVYVPMSFLGQESVNAVQAALCANEQGKFFDMHDAIFATHDGKEGNGKYTIDKLKIIAKTIKDLDQEKFIQCLDSSKYSTVASQIDQTSNTAGVQGTPTFYVNGKQVQAGWSSISAAIQSAGVSLS